MVQQHFQGSHPRQTRGVSCPAPAPLEQREEWGEYMGPGNSDARGFTLAEVLTAACILVVSLLFIMIAFPVGYRDIVYGGRVSQAVALAQQKLEETKAGTFPPVGGSATNGVYTINWTVASVGFGAAVNDLQKVTVTITWPQMVRSGRYDLVGFVSKSY